MKTRTRTLQYEQEKGWQYEERNMNTHTPTPLYGQEKGWQYMERNRESPHSYAVKRIGKRMGRLIRRHDKQKVCKEILYTG